MYANRVMVIASGISAVGGLLTLYMIGLSTPSQTISEWRLFGVVFGVSQFTTLSFLICGSGGILTWVDPNFTGNENIKRNKDTYLCSGVTQKRIFIAMAFLSMWITNCIRVILSITITKMVPPPEEIIRFTDDTCPGFEKHIYSNSTVNNEVYEWDEYTQGLILSSYFWGYTAAQFPCGYLSERFGGKHLLGFGTFLASVLTIAIPFVTALGNSTALIVVRIAIGIFSGSMYPASSTMIAQWTTPAERTKFGSVIFAGAILGTVFGTTIPAVLMTYTNMGWSGVFYCFGMLGVMWFPLWALLCYNSPEEHPFISETELNYLRSGLTKQVDKILPPAPWKYILKSKEYWAYVMSLIGLDWAYYTITSDLPKYMNDVIKFSVESNGYLSSLPHLCMWFNAIFSSWFIDKIIVKEWMSLTTTRKLFATIGIGLSSFFILGASYAECNQALVVTMFIIGITLMGSSYPTVMINNLDLSPNYAGSVMAVGNGIAAFGGVFTPYIVGLLTPNQTISEWRLVFWIVFAICAFTNLSFLICGSGEVQEWDDPNFVANKSNKSSNVIREC